MHIEILNTGAELMAGRTLNTHAMWMSARLADQGYTVARHTVVDDSALSIQAAIKDAASRADLVITTGGLGPTSDDRTRHLIAEWAGLELREDPTLMAHIEDYFSRRNRLPPPLTRCQALLPAGAEALVNHHGTAPGLLLQLTPKQTGARPCLLIMLPGPPRELHPMFTEQVIPHLQKTHPAGTQYATHTLKLTGIGESDLEALLTPSLTSLVQAGLEIAYCARPGELDLRFALRGDQATTTVARAATIARSLLQKHLFSENDEPMESVIVRLLTRSHQTLATAESCTGGLISNRITNIPGASAIFLAGLVTYSNAAKQTLLGVSPHTLEHHGAVSKQTALEMARGARDKTGATYALSVTGIAGPGGGTDDKPAGTVFIGIATPTSLKALRFYNPVDRPTFKQITSQQALNLLRRHLLPHPEPKAHP